MCMCSQVPPASELRTWVVGVGISNVAMDACCHVGACGGTRMLYDSIRVLWSSLYAADFNMLLQQGERTRKMPCGSI
jgi:hypothetical protein